MCWPLCQTPHFLLYFITIGQTEHKFLAALGGCGCVAGCGWLLLAVAVAVVGCGWVLVVAEWLWLWLCWLWLAVVVAVTGCGCLLVMGVEGQAT